MKFYERMQNDMGLSLRNLIIEQDKWLKIMSEEQPTFDAYGDHNKQ